MQNNKKNKGVAPIIEPEKLVIEVEEVVAEKAGLEELAGELAGIIEEQNSGIDGNLDKKTLAEIVAANAEANPDKLPCYVTGDGNCFAKNAYTYALKHCKGKEGLALYHCVKGKNGWVVK